MALPVAGWLAFMVATTIWFQLSHPTSEGGLVAEVDVWTRLMGIWTRLIIGANLVAVYLLVGALVLEDALAGTTEFWKTRPITNARLFAAKLLTAFVLFVLAPLAVLVPLWLAAGFGVRDLATAAGEFAVSMCGVLAVGLAVASLARDLAQFLFTTLGLGVAYVLGSAYFATAPFIAATSLAVRYSRGMILQLGLVPVAAAVVAHQFLTRRTARSWVLIGVALAACLAVRVAWPWNLRDSFGRAPQLSPDDAASIEIAPQLTKPRETANDHYVPMLPVTAPWNAAGFYSPMGAWLDEGESLQLESGWDIAGKRALGIDQSIGPITWRLSCVMRAAWYFTPENAPTWRGRLSIWFSAPRVLGEVPLREGEAIAMGASRTRILGFARTGQVIDQVFVEVRDAKPEAGKGVRELASHGYGSDWVDAYFYLDRARQEAHWLRMEVIGAVAMNALLATTERLHVPGRVTEGDGTLAVVRFERVREFEQPIEVRGLKWEEPR